MQPWTHVRHEHPSEFLRLLARALTAASGAPLLTAPHASIPAAGPWPAATVPGPRSAASAASAFFASIPWKK